MHLQTVKRFLQNEIKRLNEKYHVDMFTTNIRGSKAFFLKQKISELKKTNI